MPTSYLLKVTLKDMPKLIWRRFVVPSNMSLDGLHEVLQVVMGWDNSHLHVFIVGKQRYYPTMTLSDDFPDDLPEEDFTLADVAGRKGTKIRYEYDFGDGWEHEIVVENTDYSNPDWPYPVYCMEGVRACPPEDCGGVGGYANFCDAMADKKHPEHHELKEWYGDKFDPDHFDLAEVNKVLGVKPSKATKPPKKQAEPKPETNESHELSKLGKKLKKAVEASKKKK